MYIVSKHTVYNNDIEIIHYEEETDDSTYNKCFNCIMDEIETYKDDNISVKIINKNFISVFGNGYLYGKYHIYNYEIHDFNI